MAISDFLNNQISGTQLPKVETVVEFDEKSWNSIMTTLAIALIITVVVSVLFYFLIKKALG